MIQIGDNVIASTDSEYAVEYIEPLVSVSSPIVVLADGLLDAGMLATVLDGIVKTRTVYTSEWKDA